VRGASALGRLLDEDARDGRDLAATIVWEPVLDEDAAPPPSQWVAAARNYWDPPRTLSAALRRSPADPACVAAGDTTLDVVWDAVFVYDAGARWDDAPPAPSACGRTILRALPAITAHLNQQKSR
jgi:hypothetical protein